MGTAISKKRTEIVKPFTAVDLVTLAVFAALYRAMWYVWQALNAFVPFNWTLNAFFFCLAGVAAAVIVRKPFAISLFVVATQMINFALQGEMIVVAVIFLAWGILADGYIYFRLRAGADPFRSRRDMMIAGTLMSFMWTILTIEIAIWIIYMVDLPTNLYILISFLCFLAGIVGGWIGFNLGDRIKGLIG